MEKKLFEELVQSLKEAKSISVARAANQPVRDVRAIREKVGLSQSEFAQLMRVSVKTLQNWEQHRRHPSGPASALLQIVSTAPKIALASLHG